ncbi:very short patch repair endonuclease (plasmid) [Delftia tsuruhatensis]
MDVVDVATRSRMMAGIRSKNTRPEVRLRRFLHGRGFRYRLHARNLPGSPDIVLSKYRVVIFVHGCFWHQHSGCKYATMPHTNKEKWQKKFADNAVRDQRNMDDLIAAGWRPIVVWECAVRNKVPDQELEWIIAEILAGPWN